MASIVPNSRPRLSSGELRERTSELNINRDLHPLVVVGIRGYYRETMGHPDINDRGIYDDAIFIDSPNGTVSYNANTDPSAYRKGRGPGTLKGLASLKPGLWLSHQFGLHKNYLALVQTRDVVTVLRDGDPDYDDTGYFGINIHRGGYNETSSLGCQTIYPTQWVSFIGLAKSEAMRHFGANWNRVTIPYLLL